MKSLVKTGVCGNCGYEYATAQKRAALRQEIQALKEQLKIRQDMMGTAATELAAVEQSQKGSNSALLWTILLFGLPGGLCLLSSCAAFAQGDGEGGMIVFVLALPLLAIGAVRLNNTKTKEQKAREVSGQLQQQIATLNAEAAGLENELQAKRAEFERLGQ